MNILSVVLIIVSLILIVAGTMQSGKSEGGAGAALGGGSSNKDNYFSKGKSKSKDARLVLITKVSAILLVALSIGMVVLQKFQV